jgi:hypothetical protein
MVFMNIMGGYVKCKAMSRVVLSVKLAKMVEARALPERRARTLGILTSTGTGDILLMRLKGGYSKCKAMSRDVLLANMAEARALPERRARSLGILTSRGTGDVPLMSIMGGYSKCKAMSLAVLLVKMAETRAKRATTQF